VLIGIVALEIILQCRQKAGLAPPGERFGPDNKESLFSL
jgi:hypothetical protein